MLKIGVLASHQGTNFQAIVDACQKGLLAAEVGILISNNSRSGVMSRAASAGIPTAHLSSATHADSADLDAAILKALEAADAELVVLAGYMKRLGPRVLTRFQDRIINVHPSLLPKHGGQGFFGMRVHEAVIAARETESGASVHLVSDEYDTGAVLAQQVIDVKPDETAESLSARIRPLEHQLLVQVINQFAGEHESCANLP